MPTSLLSAAARWQFNIDAHLNRFVPPSVVPHLPAPVAYLLGHRTAPPRKLGNVLVIAWAFVGVFCGVSVVNQACDHVPAFRVDVDGTGIATPINIGSFGAAAVLEFYAIESPLAQPRNAVVGHALASLVGVALAKLFALAGPGRFATLRWLAGSLACAVATALMALTGTVHPPAGATALIAVTDDAIRAVGWYLVPAVLLGSVLMQCVALLLNNMLRRFPIYWWSPETVGQFWRRPVLPSSTLPTAVPEKSPGHPPATLVRESSSSHDRPATAHDDDDDNDDDDAAAAASTDTADPEAGHVTFTQTRSVTHASADADGPPPRGLQVIITRNAVVVPESMNLRPEERLVLETLSERL